MNDEAPPPPRILADPQDPLPEANWFWRRVFTFIALGLAFAILIGLGWAVHRIVNNIVGRIDTMDAVNVAQITVVALNAILAMFRMMFYTVLVVVTYYMVAPSAEQITKMLQTARLLKAGVQIASRAKVSGPGREETQATIGLPPQPQIPGREEPSDAETAASRLEGDIAAPVPPWPDSPPSPTQR